MRLAFDNGFFDSTDKWNILDNAKSSWPAKLSFYVSMEAGSSGEALKSCSLDGTRSSESAQADKGDPLSLDTVWGGSISLANDELYLSRLRRLSRGSAGCIVAAPARICNAQSDCCFLD